MKAQGGRIDVLSEGLGKGVAFLVRLPLKAEDGDKSAVSLRCGSDDGMI